MMNLHTNTRRLLLSAVAEAVAMYVIPENLDGIPVEFSVLQVSDPHRFLESLVYSLNIMSSARIKQL